MRTGRRWQASRRGPAKIERAVEPGVRGGFAVGELQIVGDHTAPGARKGGHKWVHEVIEDVRAPVSLRVLTWDPAALDVGEGPDDVVRDQGRGAWHAMTQPRAWLPAHVWLATRAVECAPAGATPAKLAEVAKEWGACLRDAQERAAYVDAVATRLGLDGAALRRELDARAEGRYIPRNLSTPTALAREPRAPARAPPDQLDLSWP